MHAHTPYDRPVVQMVQAWSEWEGDHPLLLTHCGGMSSSIQHLMRTDWLFPPSRPPFLLSSVHSIPPPPLSNSPPLLCPFPSVWRQRATSQLEPRDPAGEVGRDNAAHPGGCISTHGQGFVLWLHEHPSYSTHTHTLAHMCTCVRANSCTHPYKDVHIWDRVEWVG